MSQQPSTNPIIDKISNRLVGQVQNLVGAAGERLAEKATERLSSTTERLTEYAKQGGNPGMVAAATGAQKMAGGSPPGKAMFGAGLAGAKEKLKAMFGKGGGGSSDKIKVTNIIESIDVGVPVRVAYNQWTQYEDMPSFLKKLENVERDGDEKTTWKAQVFWSHRSWEAKVVEQVPDERIVWRSEGAKGSVDGTVSFHELAPDLTRILVVLEYHPQGFMEKTGNIWRAQGRRVRLELKHFVRHVMTRTVLDPDEVEGWRGEIRDGQVVRDHETVVEEERREREELERADDNSDDDAPDPDDQEQDDEDDYDEEPDRDEEPEPVRAGKRGRR
ncbi:SRPBCC family protein [Micromonospora zhanjiangensis]|uniref:SRPBCC family protein n=1 Tax=Micromonospora zhanjiangensis TaxID=1522057 RepID=A0ABV8KJW7_9ACTN